MQSDQLAHVKDAFARLGYEQAESAADDWTVLWAFHSPFHQREGEPDVPALVDKMKSHQMVRCWHPFSTHHNLLIDDALQPLAAVEPTPCKSCFCVELLSASVEQE